jgi:hypothetical protein
MTEPPSNYRESCTRLKKKISRFEQFLLFLSKTELFVLQFCTDETRMIMSSIGMSVLLTGIIATFSSFFAIQSTFFWNETTFSAFFIPAGISLIYAIAIMSFDREVVSATNKWAIALRIPFAILLGFVISFPFEMKLQQAAIDEHIVRTAEEQNKPKIQTINDYYEKIAKVRETELSPLRQSIAKLEDSIATLTAAHDKECLNPNRMGCGPIADSIMNAREEQVKRLFPLKTELERKSSSIDQELTRRFQEEKAIVDRLDAEITRAKNAHDFLTQAMALHDLTEKNYMAWVMSWALRLFFVMFELFPMLVKLFLPYTEYHAYQDARRRINVNKIITISNFADERIQKHPEDLWLCQTEVTDIMARALEDQQEDMATIITATHDEAQRPTQG